MICDGKKLTKNMIENYNDMIKNFKGNYNLVVKYKIFNGISMVSIPTSNLRVNNEILYDSESTNKMIEISKIVSLSSIKS